MKDTVKILSTVCSGIIVTLGVVNGALQSKIQDARIEKMVTDKIDEKMSKTENKSKES